MKTIIKRFLVSCISVWVCLPAAADLLFYEGFNYAAGSLEGKDGGIGFSSAWSSGTVVADGLTYTDANGVQLIVSGGSYREATGGSGRFRDVTNVLDENSSGTFWLSYLIRPDEEKGSLWGGGLSFFDNAAENLFTGFCCTTWQRYRVHSYSPDSSVVGTSDSDKWEVGQTDFIVVRLDLSSTADSDSIYMWVNPLLTSEPLIENALLTMSNRNVLATRIRMGHAFEVSMDELRLGTSWDAVSPIPEPAVVLLLVLACFLTLIGRRILDPDCRRLLFSR